MLYDRQANWLEERSDSSHPQLDWGSMNLATSLLDSRLRGNDMSRGT